MARKVNVWAVKRIGAEDAETGLRAVKWPTVKGFTREQVETLGTFEREHLGTTRAIIRMNKRAEGTEVPLPHRIAVALEGATDEIRAFYA